MMTVDTRNGWVVIIASASMGLVIVLSLVGIIVLAVTHDGQLSADAMDTFKQILLGSGLLSAALGIVERVTSMKTAQQAIAAGVNVQGSPGSVVAGPVVTGGMSGGVSESAGNGATPGDVTESAAADTTAAGGA